MSWATAAAPNTAWFISSTERARPGKFRFRHLEPNTWYLVLAMDSLDQEQSNHYREHLLQIIHLIVVSS